MHPNPDSIFSTIEWFLVSGRVPRSEVHPVNSRIALKFKRITSWLIIINRSSYDLSDLPCLVISFCLLTRLYHARWSLLGGYDVISRKSGSSLKFPRATTACFAYIIPWFGRGSKKDIEASSFSWHVLFLLSLSPPFFRTAHARAYTHTLTYTLLWHVSSYATLYSLSNLSSR